MLNWSEYLKTVTGTQTVMDSIELSYNGRIMHISPIVKASILMLEDMISAQGKHNIFVFPEIDQFSKEFLISKVIYNVTAGKIQMSYDPEKFTKGQILKYKNCAVEFDHLEEIDGRTFICIRLTDGKYKVPIEFAPFFQISDTKKICAFKKFADQYSSKDAVERNKNPNCGKNLTETLENHKTHLDSSIFYVSTIKNSKEFLTSAELNGKRITDILYMAQVNGAGDLSNLSAGQLTGNPAIILASDLYAVQNAINKGVVPQSVIFDASQSNATNSQLDAFDELGKTELPIVCVTNTANSFDLSSLSERNYNLWRWDSDSITNDVIGSEQSVANNCVRNCSNHRVEYISVKDELISNAVRLLYKQKTGIEEQPPRIISAYEKLFSLAFLMLRTVIPLETDDIGAYRHIVEECIKNIEDSKRFISTELYSDLSEAAQSLLPVFDKSYKNGKYDAVCDLVLSEKYSSACIIIPEKLDRRRYEKYWETLDFPCKIKVMYPMEYKETSECNFDIVIMVGWLGNKVMRQIIYGFFAKKYLILTYPCEEKWKKQHTKIWKKTLNNSGNSDVVKKALSNNNRQISSSTFEHPDYEMPAVSAEDELDEIEQVIRESKFKQYSNGAKTSDVVDAFPVSFVGGYLAFYRRGHKVLVATGIIVNNGDKIENKLPEELEVGDFVIVRESERDIIRDLADKILEKSGAPDLRDLSAKWKESLSVEALFSTPEEIYQKLCRYGCKSNYITVKNWMTNEDLIQPQSKEDLLCIAAATGDDVLKEKLDLIYEAGREVRNAHIAAGRILTQRLKNKIAEYILGLGEIDTFNIWDPLQLQLEEIGQVRILKVIDVSSAIPVDSGNTNRILRE